MTDTNHPNERKLTEDNFTRTFSEALSPYKPFKAWLKMAEQAEASNPNAMSLATVDEEGMPNTRIVLLKEADEEGFVFYTNLSSPKSREIATARKAALGFYWKSLSRQVRIRGIVDNVSNGEADAYFASRPRGSQIGAWASQQSYALEGRQALVKAVLEYEKRFLGQAVARPPHWSGFRLRPLSIEFWQEAPYRLHERVVFKRASTKSLSWTKQLLYP